MTILDIAGITPHATTLRVLKYNAVTDPVFQPQYALCTTITRTISKYRTSLQIPLFFLQYKSYMKQFSTHSIFAAELSCYSDKTKCTKASNCIAKKMR